MKRRHLLGLVASASVAGCSALGGQPDSNGPSVAIRDVDDAPSQASIDVAVDRQFDESSPARLSVSYTNDAEEERRFALGSSPPFSGYWPTSASRVLLVPGQRNSSLSVEGMDGVVPTEQVEGCWRLPDTLAVYGASQFVTLDAGEQISNTYHVVTSSLDEACLPAGEYRYEEPSYAESDETWGFTLVLED